jgi:hypothetical protein
VDSLDPENHTNFASAEPTHQAAANGGRPLGAHFLSHKRGSPVAQNIQLRF